MGSTECKFFMEKLPYRWGFIQKMMNENGDVAELRPDFFRPPVKSEELLDSSRAGVVDTRGKERQQLADDGLSLFYSN